MSNEQDALRDDGSTSLIYESENGLIEALADELGQLAGRVERELNLRVGTVIARLEQRDAEREARSLRLEQELRERIAAVRDGKDGRDGLDGKAGEPGAAGLVGPVGPAGEAGARGEAGPQGERGEPGEPGLRGEKGVVGESGPPGPSGERGEKGERGEQGQQGLIGSPGPTGPIGERGPVGPPGIQGERGRTVIGPRGEAGPAGQRGLQGIAGERGAQGQPGETGEPGEPGIGLQGIPGERGAKGDPGSKGDRGADGKDGRDGKLPMVKAFIEGVHYAGDVVAHSGSLYQAQRDTGATAGANADWICLAHAGRDGLDGRSFNILGTFDERTSYKQLDVVTLNSVWFVAKRDNPGPCPGEGWKAGPDRGKMGKPGERGERGATGPRGETGPAGRDIVGWKIDRSNFSATPIMNDGEDGAPLSIRELFEQFQDEAR
jgi:integrin beta 3